MEYAEMLKRAKEQLPEIAEGSERFELPRVKGHIQGNATIISNFAQIADDLNRPMRHVLKFLSKELAAKGVIKKDQYAIFNSKLSASRINDKIAEYAQAYVLCSDCGKPDTKIEKIGQALFLKCQACGAKHALKKAI